MKVVVFEYYCLPEKILCLTFNKDSERPEVFEINVDGYELRRVASDWAKGYLEADKEYRLCESWVRFSEKMLKGILQFSQENDHLLLVPNSYLFYLPFQALTFDSTTFLVDRNSLSYLPSLSFMRHLAAEGRTYDRMVGVAVEFESEINKIVKVSNMEVVTPPEGQGHLDKKIILELLASEIGFMHFSTHGYFNHFSPNQSGLHLKKNLVLKTLTDPFYNRDYILSVDDILHSRVNTKAIVLSSCETGMNHINPGDELEGMTTAFLVAGSQTVISSLWKAFSFDAETFFVGFYKYLRKAKTSIGTALRLSQLDLKRSTNDPLRWAMFVLNGSFQ
jgi:CHAT domain-containing protein